MERAEEPEWSPKGRAKLSLPFQSFCHSVTRLLVLQLIYLSCSLFPSFSLFLVQCINLPGPNDQSQLFIGC